MHPEARADGPFSEAVASRKAETLRLMAAQEPLDRAADSIHKRVAQEKLIDFTGIAIDARTMTLTLYWHGAVPASITDSLSQLSPTINVRTVQAPYSFATLDAEQHRLMDLDRSSPTGPRIVMTGILPDFSGLLVCLDQRHSTTVTEADAQRFRSPLKTALKTAMPTTPL